MGVLSYFVGRRVIAAMTVLCVRRCGCYAVFTAKEPIFSFREIDGFLRKTKKRKFDSTICTAKDADAVLRRKARFVIIGFFEQDKTLYCFLSVNIIF